MTLTKWPLRNDGVEIAASITSLQNEYYIEVDIIFGLIVIIQARPIQPWIPFFDIHTQNINKIASTLFIVYQFILTFSYIHHTTHLKINSCPFVLTSQYRKKLKKQNSTNLPAPTFSIQLFFYYSFSFQFISIVRYSDVLDSMDIFVCVIIQFLGYMR